MIYTPPFRRDKYFPQDPDLLYYCNLRNGLVAYWDLEQDFNDSSGNNHHLTYVGNSPPQFVSSQIGDCFYHRPVPETETDPSMGSFAYVKNLPTVFAGVDNKDEFTVVLWGANLYNTDPYLNKKYPLFAIGNTPSDPVDFPNSITDSNQYNTEASFLFGKLSSFSVSMGLNLRLRSSSSVETICVEAESASSIPPGAQVIANSQASGGFVVTDLPVAPDFDSASATSPLILEFYIPEDVRPRKYIVRYYNSGGNNNQMYLYFPTKTVPGGSTVFIEIGRGLSSGWNNLEIDLVSEGYVTSTDIITAGFRAFEIVLYGDSANGSEVQIDRVCLEYESGVQEDTFSLITSAEIQYLPVSHQNDDYYMIAVNYLINDGKPVFLFFFFEKRKLTGYYYQGKYFRYNSRIYLTQDGQRSSDPNDYYPIQNWTRFYLAFPATNDGSQALSNYTSNITIKKVGIWYRTLFQTELEYLFNGGVPRSVSEFIV